MVEFGVSGKTAIVTGANTGLGAGIALALAEAGAHVVTIGRSPADETINTIQKNGGRAIDIRADLSEKSAPDTIFTALANHEISPDILVNNAGIIKRQDALEFSEDNWDLVMDVNLRACFFLSQKMAQSLTAAGKTGKIINIASMLSFQGGIRVASYTASKSGLMGLTRLLACQ